MASQQANSPEPDDVHFGYVFQHGSQLSQTHLPPIQSFFELDYGPLLDTPSNYALNHHSQGANSQSSPDFIDLTNDSTPPTSPMDSLRRRTSAEPARKRRRLVQPSEPIGEPSQPIDIDQSESRSDSPPGLAEDSDEIEEVDLTHVQNDLDLKKHQAEQRRRHAEMQEQQNQMLKDSVTAQLSPNSGSSKLSKLSCIICMENMTDMTATYCGHIFCHACIMEALIAGERSGPEPGKGLSKCPVCRKKVLRSEGKVKDPQQVIPLEIKFIRRSEKAKGKQREGGDQIRSMRVSDVLTENI